MTDSTAQKVTDQKVQLRGRRGKSNNMAFYLYQILAPLNIPNRTSHITPPSLHPDVAFLGLEGVLVACIGPLQDRSPEAAACLASQ